MGRTPGVGAGGEGNLQNSIQRAVESRPHGRPNGSTTCVRTPHPWRSGIAIGGKLCGRRWQGFRPRADGVRVVRVGKAALLSCDVE